MVAPLITSSTDPLVSEVRSYNVLLDDASTFPAAKILDALNKKAFPRIRGYLMTATNETGARVFYGDLTELGNPANQAQIDTMVVQVMTQSIVKEFVFRIASAFAAAWLTRYLAAQIPEQALMANDLEKQALADLKILVNSPELSAAAASVKEKLDKVKEDDIPKIYLGLDVDPSTYDSDNNTATTYKYALEAGMASLWLGPYNVQAKVNVGDTPAIIMQRLGAAVRSYMMLNPAPNAKFNLVVGPNEGHLGAYSRSVSVSDLVGSTSIVQPMVYTNIGWLSFHAYQYDANVDALFCTLELTNASGDLGIKGLLYGQMGTELDYSKLSQKGPYSVFIDVSAGKAGVTNPAVSTSIDEFTSDTFWFVVDTPNARTSANAVVRYQVANLHSIPGGGTPVETPRTLIIPAGSTALDIVKAIARDMETISYEQKVLGAIRSSTQISIMGDPVEAPGLRIVPYRATGFDVKIIFDMLEVPADVKFGVLPEPYVTNGAFDSEAKSLILPTVYNLTSVRKLSPNSTTIGEVRNATPKVSKRLSSALGDIEYFNNSLW